MHKRDASILRTVETFPLFGTNISIVRGQKEEAEEDEEEEGEEGAAVEFPPFPKTLLVHSLCIRNTRSWG